ncbi:hypothetical protein BDW62DRAFT_210812 [Aspergillus aurantiobrunneus]
MLPFLKFVPLVLSAAVLICLAVAFSACTSTSSPQDLFFMEVNLMRFPKTDHLNPARSFDSPGNAVSQIGGHVQDLSDQLYSLLPEYYAVGLWSYCESNTFFSFDLVDVLSSRLGQVNGVLADWAQPVLKGYRRVSHSAYMMAFIAAFIAVVAGLVGFPLAKLVAIISSVVTLEQAGISASLGPRMLAISWLAVAFSVGLSLFWIVERCCCCCL